MNTLTKQIGLKQKQMAKIEMISVKTTFRVGVGGFEVSQKVYDQLLEMEENDIELDGTGDKYPEANEWLRDNVHLGDCTDVEYVVKSLR